MTNTNLENNLNNVSIGKNNSREIFLYELALVGLTSLGCLGAVGMKYIMDMDEQSPIPITQPYQVEAQE